MLRVSNIAKSYGTAVILDNVSFTLNEGERVGLIGPNGCGKSTLLRIITGQELPDRGAVQLNPSGLRVGYLEQGIEDDEAETVEVFIKGTQAELNEVEARVASLAAALSEADGPRQAELLHAYGEALEVMESLARSIPEDHEIDAVMEALGLENLSFETPLRILSGGQKTRLGLARLLLHHPQLLLLDEPTNHLDINALEWLETWLRAYQGALLVVSHDRTFLDNIVGKIFELDEESHTLVEYVGNYTAYLEAWEQRREKQWSQWKDERAETRRLHQDIVQTRNQALSVEATTKPSQPSVRRLAKKVAMKAKAREKKLERYVESEDRVEKPGLSWRMKLDFADMAESSRDVLRLENLSVGYGTPLLDHANAHLRAGERVALVGPNGCGKTTLLHAILGHLPLLAGQVRLGASVQVGYYAQDQQVLDFESTPFDTLREVAAISDTEIRSFLHYFLFTGDEVFVPIGSLSYGERARLALARLVAMGCNFLVLDEPINHLDIPSRTQFEHAMTAFGGTVLAVVHDRYFIRHFATALWAIEDGKLHRYMALEDIGRMAAGTAEQDIL
ncbi:MAG: ABC-F family ATP-binding cassette domain-containing protein [Anaerolineae bacterium]|jgi:ATP-binding cassette subfamily F protein 3|nr:ABC-F family ATP-binding cassette domain-containing protein [Anaerolineae bacterium]